MMTTKISIKNQQRGSVVIDIEGVIGVIEESQFDNPNDKTATYDKFSSQLEQIAAINAERVVVNIRSTGGDVGDALLIHDSLCALEAAVTTRCYGYVASAATIIAQAATEGCREISSNSLYLIHKSACSTEGNATDLSQTLSLLDKTDRRIAEIYALRSGRDASVFAELMEENGGKGRWLTPQQTLDAGLADRMIKSSPLSNNAAQMISSMGLPPIPEQLTNNDKKANMKQKWRSILGVLGVNNLADKTLSNNDFDSIEQELATRQRTIASLVKDKAELAAALSERIEALSNKISILEAQNAKFNAPATATNPKEDPSYGEQRLSNNDQAYSNDIRNFG